MISTGLRSRTEQGSGFPAALLSGRLTS